MLDDLWWQFERSLVVDLGYDMPAEIMRTLLAGGGRLGGAADCAPLSTSVAVDLGCGTGLAGAKVRHLCTGRMFGCDLSQKMLDVAKEKNIYDDLKKSDVVAFLYRCVPPAAADLIIAADVLVYARRLARPMSSRSVYACN